MLHKNSDGQTLLGLDLLLDSANFVPKKNLIPNLLTIPKTTSVGRGKENST